MTARTIGDYQICPAKYFSAAPTYFTWNALTAYDVHHTLQARPGFEGQNLYFILNHPIKFVRIVGVLVDVEILGNGKYLILTLDDGSGSTIECKTEVRQPDRRDETVGNMKIREHWPSTTLVDNLDARIDFGVPKVAIDEQGADVGVLVKAKGTIDTFRQQRQLKLERIRIVKDTNEEAKAWQETAELKTETLSRPWVLTEARKVEIDAKLAQEMASEAEKSKKKRSRDAKYEQRKLRHEEKKERKRRALEGDFDKGALSRSGILPDRVTDS